MASAIVALAIAMPGSAAHAEVSFSPAERAIIARNASLRAILARDPAQVRRVLDRMAVPRPRTGDPHLGPEAGGTRDQTLPGGDRPSFDPGEDPDLGALQRASPEAAHDLFQILKQASRPKQKSGE